MFGSAIVYSGLAVAFFGLIAVVRPIRRIGMLTRLHGSVVAAAGLVLAVVGLVLPASESRVQEMESRLDEFVPTWQFREIHTIRIAAPPERVYDAIRRVRADEISLFRALTCPTHSWQRLFLTEC